MGLVDELLQIESDSSGKKQCLYNGLLKDYINNQQLDKRYKEVYELVVQYFEQAYIIHGLKISVNTKIIPNQIIRYKDITKLEGKSVFCNDIIYLSLNDVQKALIFSPLDKGSYLMVKGNFLVLTEPGSQFIDYRNDIVALASDDPYQVVNVITDLLTNKAGAIQRKLEYNIYHNFQQLYDDALAYDQYITEKARKELPLMSYKEDYINELIMKWFILKKLCYVTYMVDKAALNTLYNGDIKLQRSAAKKYSDGIQFIPYSQLWHLTNQD